MDGIVVEHWSVHVICGGFDSYFRLPFHSVLAKSGKDHRRLEDFPCILYTRVPTPPGKSWIFFLENSRTWKVLEKYPENYAFLLVLMENKQK